MSHGYGIPALLEARRGRPTPELAAGTIATLAVIPAAIAGILLGVLFTDVRDSAGRLFAIVGAIAFFCGIGTWLGIRWLCHRRGFRSVVRVANFLLGGSFGLILAAGVALFVDLGTWILLLGPAFAVAGLFAPVPAISPDEPPATV